MGDRKNPNTAALPNKGGWITNSFESPPKYNPAYSRPCDNCSPDGVELGPGCTYCHGAGYVRKSRHRAFRLEDNLMHGLRTQSDPADLPVEPLRELKPATTTQRDLVLVMDDMVVIGQAMLEKLVDIQRVDLTEAVGYWGQRMIQFQDLREKLLGGQIDPVRYGPLDAVDLAELKEEVAHALRGMLKQLKLAYAYCEKAGVWHEESKTLHWWAGPARQGMGHLMYRMMTPIKQWAALLAYEGGMGSDPSPTEKAVHDYFDY